MEASKSIIYGVEKEARRICVPSVEEVRSEARLAEVEISVPLT